MSADDKAFWYGWIHPVCDLYTRIIVGSLRVNQEKRQKRNLFVYLIILTYSLFVCQPLFHTYLMGTLAQQLNTALSTSNETFDTIAQG